MNESSDSEPRRSPAQSGISDPGRAGNVSARDRRLCDEENRDLLVERSRVMAQFVIAFVLLFALADIRLAGSHLRALYLLKGAVVGFAMAALLALGRPWGRRWVKTIDIAVGGLTCVLTAAQSALIHDTVAFSFAPVFGSLFTAAFIPWGAATQAIFVAVCSLMIAVNAWGLGLGYEHVGALGSALLSIYLAHKYDRHRLSLWLAEHRLLEAKELAERAERAKSAFLATMSHELRTPMNAVIGMAEVLLAEDLPEKHREAVETIRTGGDALLTVIDDILDFSRIEAGELSIDPRAFDLDRCLARVIDLLRPRARTKGLFLHAEIDPETPCRIVCDEIRLRQILFNLVSNAIKFTSNGSIAVHLTSQPMAGSHHELRGRVEDTGIGIPADRMNHLFQPFVQVDESSTRKHGGTGLGLTISRRLCEMMGGTLWAESNPGPGSTFHFTLIVSSAAGDDAPESRRRCAEGSDL